MKRSSITRRTPLSRARLKARPPEPAAGGGYASAREAVLTRSGSRCENCGTRLTLASLNAHHRRRRSAGRSDAPANLVALCSPCHAQIHAYPAQSLAAGHLISRHDHRDPCHVPIRIRTAAGPGWVLLTDDGRAVPLPGWTPLP